MRSKKNNEVVVSKYKEYSGSKLYINILSSMLKDSEGESLYAPVQAGGEIVSGNSMIVEKVLGNLFHLKGFYSQFLRSEVC